MAYLEMRDISKKFPGVQALDHVNLMVESGEIHALLGENGAGKSTLVKILAGAYQRDGGSVLLGGQVAEIHSAHQAQQFGISIIYQELNLIPQLSVAENVFLGRLIHKRAGTVDWGEMYRQAQLMLDKLEVQIDARSEIRSLGIAQMQMVEVAKALSLKSRVLIMDEPTASLTGRETETLFSVMRRLKQEGVAIVYISHHLEEVLEVCDRATILRDGANIALVEVADTTLDELIRHMVGRDLTEKYPKLKVELGNEILRVKHLCAGKRVKDVSFSVRAGEVLGIAGLVGAGRSETARALFGLDKKETGEVYVRGQRVHINRPLDAIRAGIGFATEDRKNEGLVLTMDVGENITLASLPQFEEGIQLNLKREAAAVDEYVGKLSIKTPSLRQKVRNLSGGNQQKVVLAKWLMSRSCVFLFDEPTRGIDVGAKIEVYHIINALIEQGAAVVMISSEMPEILGMCDRIAVMHQGVIAATLDRNQDEVTQEMLLYYATGSTEEPTAADTSTKGMVTHASD
ncbi:MAG: sugar ABC transporter ATP-binding protein [Clostridia bacterium]|nr:sugar ABC transporter ATP-binding protein [Clostridia bacterium]